jgi:RHS repeat-associated protein
MIKDHNKGITLITYNHLNLPTTIQFGSINTITYIYNAVGQKVLKKVRTGNEYANTDYLTGFQYRSSYTETQGNQSTAELQYFPTAEGYVQQKDGRYFYVYHYTDHLGNIRLSYSLDPETQMIKIMEENHYYPFGLKHEFYNTATMKFAEKMAPNTNEAMIVLEQANNFVGDGSYNYKYNGKELQDELGLNMYDYGARNYDPAIGRWMNIDPLAERGPQYSPYCYTFNNPINLTDPDGRWPDPPAAWYSASRAISGAFNSAKNQISKAVTWVQNHAVAKVEGKVTVGAQIGVKTPFGSAGVGVATVDVAKAKVSTTGDNYVKGPKEMDGKGHYFAEAKVNIPGDALVAGGKVDWVNDTALPNGNGNGSNGNTDLLQSSSYQGKVEYEGSFGPKGKSSKADVGDISPAAVKYTATGSNKEDCSNCFEIKFGAKAVIGFEVKVTIGVNK